jgi:ABC-type uncharacterized transport system permease subunit
MAASRTQKLFSVGALVTLATRAFRFLLRLKPVRTHFLFLVHFFFRGTKRGGWMRAILLTQRACASRGSNAHALRLLGGAHTQLVAPVSNFIRRPI